jgi:hypothetical protein
MEIIKEGTNRQQASGDFSCGCDYCECSCDTDTLLPEDKKVK